MRVSMAALALLIGESSAFIPPTPRKSVRNVETISSLQQAARPEFPTPQVTSTTRISTDTTQMKSILEARHSLLEIETSAEQAREYLEYLEKVAHVVEQFLQDESTPLRANFLPPELQNVKQATDYLMNIELATSSAQEYLTYLEKMSREIKSFLRKFESEYRKEEQAQEATCYLEDLEETAEAARDYLKYLQTVSSVVQTYLVDPNLSKKIPTQGMKQIQDFLPTHTHKTATREEQTTHSTTTRRKIIPPPAPSLEVDSNIAGNKVVSVSFRKANTRKISSKTENVGAYLESLKPTSTRLTAVSGDKMEYLDTVASSSQESGVLADGGTISQYLSSIDPQQRGAAKSRRYLRANDLRAINEKEKRFKSPLDYEKQGVVPTQQRRQDGNDYDRAKAAASGMMDIPAGKPQTRRNVPPPQTPAGQAPKNDPVDWSSQARNPADSSPVTTGSSSPLVGEVPMPSDWMQPKGPMASLFGGGSSTAVPQQSQRPPEIQRPTTSSPARNIDQMSPSSRGPPTTGVPPSALVDNDTTIPTQLDNWMKPKGPMAGSSASSLPPQGRQTPAASYSTAPVTDGTRRKVPPASFDQQPPISPNDWMQAKGPMAGGGSASSSAGTVPRQSQGFDERRRAAAANYPQQNMDMRGSATSVPSTGETRREVPQSSFEQKAKPAAPSDWMQPKGPMAGASASSSPTAPNDWLRPKGPMSSGSVSSSLPPPEVSRQPRNLMNEVRNMDVRAASYDDKISSEPPPVPPEAYLDQMAMPNETVDWSNYNTGTPAIPASSSATTLPSPEPFNDETAMPGETVDWSYVDPDMLPSSPAAQVSPETRNPIASSSSYDADQVPWTTSSSGPSQEQVALTSTAYQDLRRPATTLPPVPKTIRAYLDQVKLSTQRGQRIDWSRTKDTKRIRVAPPRPEESEYYPNPLPQTSQPVDWTSVVEASTIPEPGTGGYLQSKPYARRMEEGSLAPTKYFFLEEPVEDFFFTKFERQAGEPISPKLPILGAKYMEQLEQVARKNPLNLKDEMERRRVRDEVEKEEPGRIERTLEAGETINGRLAMFFLCVGLAIEFMTGATLPAQVGVMRQEFTDFAGHLQQGSSPEQKLVQTPAAPKVEKAIQEAGSSKVQQSVHATVTTPSTPPVRPPQVAIEPPVEVTKSPKQEIPNQPTAETTKAQTQQPVREAAPVSSPPIAVEKPTEVMKSPKQEIPNQSTAEATKTQQEVKDTAPVTPPPPPAAVDSSVEAPKSTSTQSSTAATEVQKEEVEIAKAQKQVQDPVTSPSPPPVVEPPAADKSSSTDEMEKDEAPTFPNLEDWSF